MDIGLKIKEIAGRKNIKVGEIAKQLDMTVQGVYYILKKRSIKLNQLEKIAEILDVPLNFFFNDIKISVENGYQNDIDFLKSQIDDLKQDKVELYKIINKLQLGLLNPQDDGKKTEASSQ